MNTRIKRPPAIWLTQSLLIIFALLFFSVFLINLANLLSNLREEFSLVRAIIGYSVMFGIVLLLLSSFWGLAKRKVYGRWLGLLSLILLWGLIIFIQLRRPSGPYEYYKYDNPAQLIGAAIFQIFLHGLFLTLILRLAFAKRVSEFFRKEIEPA